MGSEPWLQPVPDVAAEPLATLLACFAGEPPPDIDWPSALAAANRALVTGILADRIGDRAPPDVRAFLAAIRDRTAERNARLAAQLREALGTLNAAGIRPILLKGAAILNTAGVDCSGRIVSDLDLMVPPSAMGDAVRCLGEIGYREYAPSGLALGPRNLFRPQDVGMLDLHSRTKVRHPGLAYQDLLGDCTDAAIGGASAWLPSPTAQAFFFILHDQLQERDYWRGLVDLRHLLDLAALARAPGGVDWAALADRFPSGFPRRALAVQLRTAETFFALGIPAHLHAGRWPRLQVRRRLAQLRRPWLRVPLTLLTWLADPPWQAGLAGPRATPIEHSRLSRLPLPQPLRHAFAAASRLVQQAGPGKL
jgi:hypothetical protein